MPAAAPYPMSGNHATPEIMNPTTRTIIERHWALANARDWDGFARLLSPNLRYDVPQTREYIETGEGYLDMFRTWPGEWTARVKNLACEGDEAICIIDFVVGDQTVTGISVFRIAQAKIVAVTDYWPDPYDPPPRLSAHMRRAAD